MSLSPPAGARLVGRVRALSSKLIILLPSETRPPLLEGSAQNAAWPVPGAARNSREDEAWNRNTFAHVRGVGGRNEAVGDREVNGAGESYHAGRPLAFDRDHFPGDQVALNAPKTSQTTDVQPASHNFDTTVSIQTKLFGEMPYRILMVREQGTVAYTVA